MKELIKIKKERGIVEVLLNRPDAFNAFDLDTVELLAKHLINLAMDDSVSAVVITGEGKAFCAGGDLKWALKFPGGPAAAFHELAGQYHQAILEIKRMEEPVLPRLTGQLLGVVFPWHWPVISESWLTPPCSGKPIPQVVYALTEGGRSLFRG